MILADTSVWIDYFNGVSTWQTERLDLLLDTEPVALGDLILTEVLQGFRNDPGFRKAQAVLAELPFYELGGYAVCLQAARNYRALRAKGMTVSIKDYISYYHTVGNPGRNDLDEEQELFYPAILKAIKETGHAGFVTHEFVPKGDPIKALKTVFDTCAMYL